MPNFIAKILSADFFSDFKVAEFKHELEPSDLACMYIAQSMFVWRELYFCSVVFAYLHSWTSLALLTYRHPYTIRT